MKVTLEKGETLDVALVENERIVGSFTIELRGFGVAAQAPAAPAAAPQKAAAPQVQKPAAPEQPAAAPSKKGRGKRNISSEARAKMAEAQRRRWAKFRSTK